VYRHLAKRYHPDLDPSPEAASRMAELNEAYAVLSDRERRARYDESLGLESRHRSADETATGLTSSQTDASATSVTPYGEAGPPPPNPAPDGSRLTFGRYRGWALNQIGRFDRDYLEWLSRTTLGRNYRHELDELLRRRRGVAAPGSGRA
jgi:curved DNA-binding protein CbpA